MIFKATRTPIFYLFLSGFSLYANASNTVNVVPIDWTQTETLLALGVEPLATAQQAGYNAWVNTPTIPSHIPDIGLRTQPNLELLSELKPDKIFISPMFKNLEQQLARIAPVQSIGIYRSGDASWPAIKNFTRTLAAETHTEEKAETLIDDAEQHFVELSQNLSSKAKETPLLMLQFMDPRHMRVFGKNSMYKIAANQIGLKSAWQEKTSAWGYSLAGMDQLMNIKAQIVVVKPFPAGVEEHLEKDQLWQYIIKQSGHPLITIDPVWSFGAIPSSVKFANLLTQQLTAKDEGRL